MASKELDVFGDADANLNAINFNPNNNELNFSTMSTSSLESIPMDKLNFPKRNPTCSRFTDHFRLKEQRVSKTEELKNDFSLRKLNKNNTHLPSTSILISNFFHSENENIDKLQQLQILDHRDRSTAELKNTRNRSLVEVLNNFIAYNTNFRQLEKELSKVNSNYCVLPHILRAEIHNAFSSSFSILLKSDEGCYILRAYLCEFIKIDSASIKKLIFQLDIKSISMTTSIFNFIKMTSLLTDFDKIYFELIYERLNNFESWCELIPNKFGKNIVEHVLSYYFKDEPERHEILFGVIHSNFIHFATSNYTTFVVQQYIMNFSTSQAFMLVQFHLDVLSSSQNGIFVIISTLKAYTPKQVSSILAKLLSKIEILSKGIYSSTMIEYAHQAFPKFCTDFVESKLEYTLGKQLDLM